MSTPALLQSLSFDLQSINDLAFDEDCEIFLQLAFIWFMNSRRSWQEIFETLNGPLSVLSEVFVAQSFTSRASSPVQRGSDRERPDEGQGTSPPLHPGSESGPCGLTAYEWHVLLIFVILRQILITRPGTPAVMFVFLIAVVVAWYQTKDVSEMWHRANLRAQAARTALHEELFKHVLPQRDIERHDGPVTLGPSVVATRAHPIVNFILASLFPSMRHRPGSP
ncbi:hypothetical protein BJY52DRAFT_1225681 [Lactarius psammicola]|nr:hypothetical protein BJY52DRAFT_1225681 [Lactarius psammicola]